MNGSFSHIALLLTLLPGLAALADTHYVSVSSTNPVPPYTNWATAANVIQDAVDVATEGDTVLVTNGIYSTGGIVSSRVGVLKPLKLTSVNGPNFSFIQGYQLPGTTNGSGAIRCVYLTNGATLSGFTLTNGATPAPVYEFWRSGSGGGVRSEISGVVSNCVLTGNSAFFYGGGAFGGTLNDCVLTGNRAGFGGGGAYAATLNDCVVMDNRTDTGCGGGAYAGTLTRCLVISNSASFGGGVCGSGEQMTVKDSILAANNAITDGGGVNVGYLAGCTVIGNSAGNRGGGVYRANLTNCIVYYNSASNGPNFDLFYSAMLYSCTTPLPTNGVGNITNAPLFVDTGDWTNLRLQSNSPCVNAGNNAYVASSSDLDGNPRIVGGTVDMGAYENTDGSTVNGVPWAWLLDYGLPTDGSADFTDSDSDSATTWQEWKMWTNPTNQLSVLEMMSPEPQTNGTVVGWLSVSNHLYALERAANDAASFQLLENNIIGQAGTTTFTDTTATNGNVFLYRVSVPE